MSLLIFLLVSWWISLTQFVGSPRKIGKDLLLLYFKLLKIPSQVEQQNLQTLRSLFSHYLPSFVSLLCFLAVSVRVRLGLCWVTQDITSTSRSKDWWEGIWGGGGVMVRTRWLMSGTCCWLQAGGNTWGKPTRKWQDPAPLVLSLTVFQSAVPTLWRSHDGWMVTSFACYHEFVVWSMFNFWVKCKTADFQLKLEPVHHERDVSIIQMETVCRLQLFLRAPSLRLWDRKELNASHVWYVFLVQAKLHV